MQTGLGDGREGAVVDSHDAVVEGAEPQPVVSDVVIGAEYWPQCQDFAHLVVPCNEDAVGSSDDDAAGYFPYMLDVMPFEQEMWLAVAVDVANTTVEGCP